MRTYLPYPYPAKQLYLLLFAIVVSAFLFGCKKAAFDEPLAGSQTNEPEINAFSSRSASEIRDWLDDKKSEIGIDSNTTIDKVLYSMDDANAYTETFKDEEFIIIPIEGTGSLSRNIRTDLNAPLKFLLMVEDENGNLRKGNIALFYPSSAWTISLPQNFFKDFFESQAVSMDGTFALLSLDDVKQYEMDFENGKPKEFRLWQGKLQPAQPTGPVCYDHYLTTIIYYSDGTTEIFEEYLYTQCYDTGGGGGGSNPPNTNNPVARQRQVSFVVASKNTSYEGWTMTAYYQVSGMDYPNSPSLNYFTAVPLSTGGSSSSTSFMSYSNNMHTVTWHSWYIQFSLVHDITGLNDIRNAFANFEGKITLPNQGNLAQNFPKGKNWLASVVLH